MVQSRLSSKIAIGFNHAGRHHRVEAAVCPVGEAQWHLVVRVPPCHGPGTPRLRHYYSYIFNYLQTNDVRFAFGPLSWVDRLRLSSKFAIGFDHAGRRLRAEAATHLVVEAQLWDMPVQALALPTQKYRVCS